MSSLPDRLQVSGHAAEESREFSPAEIREQLRRIEFSQTFRTSARLQRFLHLAVERTLAGETDQLKEYSVGRDVFDRGADYDPRADSIVRVEARRLRNKLQTYYQTEGANDSLLISFPSGGYVPAFERAPEHEPVPLAAESALAGAAWDVRTIAVLPFSNLSQDAEQQFFCDGITEDIINALTAMPDLQVIGRSSMFAVGQDDPREIGERLGAGTIVEGSVRKAGEALRISAKIIDAQTRQATWSQVYDRKSPDVFVIEDEIAHSIADNLRVSFPSQLAGHKAPNVEAHVLYLRGRQAWNRMSREGFSSAIDLFTQATSLYPDYALPFAGLADVYTWMAGWGATRPLDALPKGKAAAIEALRLDPNSAHACAALGLITCILDRKWEAGSGKEGGLALVNKALAIQPGYAVGHQIRGMLAACLARFDEARQSAERAVHLDPLSFRTNRTLGMMHAFERRPEQAQQWFEAAIALQPENPETYSFLARAFLAQGRYAEAVDAAQNCDVDPPTAIPLSILGVSLARSGELPGALQILHRLKAMSSSGYADPLAFAFLYTSLGKRREALDSLRRSVAEYSPLAAFMKVDPLLDDLHSEPEFLEIVSLLQFPPQ